MNSDDRKRLDEVRAWVARFRALLTGAALADLICRRPEFRLVRLAGQEGRS